MGCPLSPARYALRHGVRCGNFAGGHCCLRLGEQSAVPDPGRDVCDAHDLRVCRPAEPGRVGTGPAPAAACLRAHHGPSLGRVEEPQTLDSIVQRPVEFQPGAGRRGEVVVVFPTDSGSRLDRGTGGVLLPGPWRPCRTKLRVFDALPVRIRAAA